MDTMSQLQGWYQAPGLSMALHLACMNRLEEWPHQGWTGVGLHRAVRGGKCLRLTDLGYLCGRETCQCVCFVLRISFGSGFQGWGWGVGASVHVCVCVGGRQGIGGGAREAKWVRAAGTWDGLGTPRRQVSTGWQEDWASGQGWQS